MTYDPATHYDRVTAAWALLLGEELHYGVFESADEPLGRATLRLSEAMLDAARIDAGHSVLDVGCGVGAPACWIAATRGARVTGITNSREGIAASLRRAEAEGVADLVAFRERDGMENGFADQSFDRVWVLESSHLMRHRDRLINECARVTRPGGRVVLCDIVLQRKLEFADVRRLREPLALLREVFGDARMEPIADYNRLAEEAGLTLAVERDLTLPTRPTFDGWRRNANRWHQEVVELFGEEQLDRFVESCDVLERFWDDGTLGYALLAWFKR